MEDLCIGNLANDMLAFLGLDGTTYLWENSLARNQYTDNGRFAGCMHMGMPQQFIERVLDLNGKNFKNRDLVIQPLTEIMKLQLGGKRNNYTPYGGLSFWAKHGGKRRGDRYTECIGSKDIGSSNQD